MTGAARREGETTLLGFATDGDSEKAIGMACAAIPAIRAEVRSGNVETAHVCLAAGESASILIVDLTGSRAPVPSMDALAELCEPHTRVIAIGARDDARLFRDLRRLGVVDYLLKPFTSTDLQETLMQCVERPAAEAARPVSAGGSRVTAFLGARGGAGATALAAATAAALANGERRVVLFDTDVQGGTAALDLDVPASADLTALLEVPERIDRAAIEALLTRHPLGFSLLAGDADLARVIRVPPEAMLATLKVLLQAADLILLDIPRRLDSASRAALRTADRVIIVTPPTLAGLRDTRRLAGFISGLRAGQRPHVVINRAGRIETEVSAHSFSEALGYGPEFIIKEMPQAAQRMAEHALPFGAGNADASQRALAARLAALVAADAGAPPRRSLLGAVRRVLADVRRKAA